MKPGPLPVEEYMRCVLRLKAVARKMNRHPTMYVRALGQSISEDVDVLYHNLRDNGYV